MGKVRLYTEGALSQGANLLLNPRQSHYICNVMRLKQGDNIYLFNGRNGEWIGEISGVSHKSARITLEECVRKQESEENLYLYCAIVKNTALNNVIRQATEMGVTCIQFILTEHTVVKSINLERAKLQSIEAAEQCGRISIPEILPPIKFSDLQSHQNKNFVLCDETGEGKTPTEILKGKKNIALIIGPEGGFSPDELNTASKFCQKLSLGKRILRVDTAVVAALAYVTLDMN